MKNILIPTDFSDCARHAVDAGLKFAKRFKATLHLYHWLDLPPDWEYMTQAAQDEYPKLQHFIKNVNKEFQTLVEDYPDISFVHSITGGKFNKTIHHYVQKNNIDLLIMGSHGVSGKSEYFIGSNTQKVVRTVHCPVLILKSALNSIDFQKVIFASSFNENEKKPFWKFRNFVKPFLPEIHLLAIKPIAIISPPVILFQEAMEDFKALCPPFHCETHTIKDYSVDQGVRAFAKQIGADLIGISNHHRRPLKRFFSGSNVEFLVNHSDLPVLCIDYVEED